MDYLTPVKITDAKDAKLTELQTRVADLYHQFFTSYFTFKTLVDLERENYIKNIENRMNNEIAEINGDYRKFILDVSENYKRVGMLALSYNGNELAELIGTTYNFNFNQKSYKDKTKLKYSREKLITSMIIALSLLFAKYHHAYEFQVQATYIKVLNDFFDYSTIIDQELYGVYSDILNLDINVIINKVKSLGLNPKEKIKVPRKPKEDKTKLPSKEQFELWLSTGQYTQTQLKQLIAKQYKTSEKTVQRKMAEYGLTRKYNKI